MGHDHHHHHHHELAGHKLGLAAICTSALLVVLVLGGFYAHSLALLADAGHVVTDVAALVLSWYATRQASRPADEQRTFGFHRTGILAALANAVSLILIALWIGYEAYERLTTPPATAVDSTIMLGVAAIGLVANLGIGLGLAREAHGNLNVKSAYLHVMGDAAASAGVIVAAIAIHFTRWQPLDPLLSVGIALLIARSAWAVLDETVHILMEGTPRHLELPKLLDELRAVPGVVGVHELHVWSLSQAHVMLSCHVVIADDRVAESLAIVAACNRLLLERYDIHHTTIQAEAGHCSPDALDCNLAFVHPLEQS